MSKLRKNGTFIAIEGIDAVGKRTQCSMLTAAFQSRGLRIATFSFPVYETEIGREIRRFFTGQRVYPLETVHMLLAANRWEKKLEIEDLLKGNDLLVVNRYSPSNLAYGIANGLDLDWLVNLEKGLPEADLVFVLDAPPHVVSSRRSRDKDRFERDRTLQERARESYLRLAEKFRWRVIPAVGGVAETNRLLMEAASSMLTER